MKRLTSTERVAISNNTNQGGFTLIETMLFLGITAAMAMSIFIGSSTTISAQRYRDSVISLQTFLQQQYSEVSNVVNDRSTDWTCDITNGVTNTGTTYRGQSDCVILGRIITIDASNKKELKVNGIVGIIPTSDLSSIGDDKVFLKNISPGVFGYGTYISNTSPQTYNLSWETSLMDHTGNDFGGFTIMILRSPLTGIIRTFINVSESLETNSRIQDRLLDLTLSQSASLKLCVYPDGLISGTPMGVNIVAGATSASGVQFISDGSATCHKHV